jgi:DNA-binding MurR/RpiR family transcriptional regulator
MSFARQAKRVGGKILVITSNVNSSLARAADNVIQLAAGDEKHLILGDLGQRFSSASYPSANPQIEQTGNP